MGGACAPLCGLLPAAGDAPDISAARLFHRRRIRRVGRVPRLGDGRIHARLRARRSFFRDGRGFPEPQEDRHLRARRFLARRSGRGLGDGDSRDNAHVRGGERFRAEFFLSGGDVARAAAPQRAQGDGAFDPPDRAVFGNRSFLLRFRQDARRLRELARSVQGLRNRRRGLGACARVSAPRH